MTVYLLHSVMEASLAAVSSTLSMSPHCRLSPHTVMGPSLPSVSSHCHGAISTVCLLHTVMEP